LKYGIIDFGVIRLVNLCMNMKIQKTKIKFQEDLMLFKMLMSSKKMQEKLLR